MAFTLRCPNPDCRNGMTLFDAPHAQPVQLVLRCRLCSDVFQHATPDPDRMRPVIGADILASCPPEPAGRAATLARYGLADAMP